MELTGIFFQLVSCLLALLAVAILIWINKEKTHRKHLLVLLLLVLAILNANGVIFHLGWYMKFPWLHKIAIPFSLLIAPAAYLYIRTVLKGELAYKKYDWLLLLPALLFAINLWPYYSMPLAEKKAYLAEYYQKSSLRSSESEGFLPAYVFYFIRVGWSIFFIFLNDRLIRRFERNAPEKVLRDNDGLLKWLKQLNGLLAGLILAALFVAIIAPIKKTGFNLLDLSLGAVVLIICLQLFRRPRLLYGIFQPTADFQVPALSPLHPRENLVKGPAHSLEAGTSSIQKTTLSSITDEDAIKYKQLVEHFFKNNQPFLNVDYSLEQLVIDINVQRYILSGFINREYGMGFREFLNRYRVEYFIKNYDKPGWKNYTLEAIAAECGFKSRITFSNNFKQFTGKSPSEYLKDRNRHDPS